MAVNGIGNSKADIRPTQLKAGMEKTNLKNDKDKAIFDAMDTDKNGVLDQSEIEKFKQTKEGKFFVINTVKPENKKGVEAIKERQIELREKRQEKRHNRKKTAS